MIPKSHTPTRSLGEQERPCPPSTTTSPPTHYAITRSNVLPSWIGIPGDPIHAYGRTRVPLRIGGGQEVLVDPLSVKPIPAGLVDRDAMGWLTLGGHAVRHHTCQALACGGSIDDVSMLTGL